MDLDAIETRVLGCLIEKQRTTPDAYPLSLNALRLACNQTTNRDPVVNYDEEMIRGALHRLGRRRFTRLASGHSSRAAKYRHLLDEALGIDQAEQAVLAVLLLRGAQTPGELKQRTERMQRFADLAELQDVLTSLIQRDLVAQLARRPGQKEDRFRHRLSEDLEDDEPTAAAAAAPAQVVVPPPPRRDERLDKLEREVAELREELAALRAELGA
ncbi:MAG TPA: YceH family protein [Solirubrobacter sp.]|nr:YceH family protein [Solirubrobacter sp.]